MPTAFPAPGRLLDGSAPAGVRPPRAIELFLDGNEGPSPAEDGSAVLAAAGGELLRRYPDASALERELAAYLGVRADELLVTAGADEALDRIARAWLGPGRELLLPSPSFEMLARYARLSGAAVREVAWEPGAPWPLSAVLAALSPRTGVVAVVSPNNPTGAEVEPESLRELATRAPESVVLVDQAYGEFSGQSLLALARTLPNALFAGTFSKARGLAGLRIGYVVGPPAALELLRRAGGPYSVAGPSLALARHFLASGDEALARTVARVRAERAELAALALELGARTFPSAANFVLWRARDGAWLADALAGLGVAVRSFPARPELARDVRITCPGARAPFERLVQALRVAAAPEALLLDMDGVLVDANDSYDATILAVAGELGLAATRADVLRLRRAGGANDDVELLARLCAGRAPRAELEQRFELRYWGPDGDGLCREERPLVARATLEALAARIPLAIVTGRPRRDALRFLEASGLLPLFRLLVCSEDAPRKPDPTPVRRALAELGCRRAWMVGDTVDDVRAARAAGVLPLGIVAPLDDPALTTPALLAAGAGRVLASLEDLRVLLP
jgi:histidinol-phosphate aminotransferase